LETFKDHIHTLVNGKLQIVLIVTQPSMIRSGFVDILAGQLKLLGVAWTVNTDIAPEPTLQNIQEVYENAVKPNRFDALIGIGGGSVLDAVKVLSVMKTNTISIAQMLGTDMIPNPGLRTVLIPSTSGTGSEVTPNAIVTLPEQQLKIGIVSRHLLPQLVIIDPALTLGLPQSITAATGMDAFTHALESYISNKANPISDMFALESIRLISHSIADAYHEGARMKAREAMIVGSMYGGMALASAGTAAVHALAYPLGGKFGIPHGVANAMLMPHVMEVNLDAIVPRLAVVAEAMGLARSGCGAAQEGRAAERVIEHIRFLTRELNIPQNLADYGVSDRDVGGLATAASKVTRLLNNNPKLIGINEMERIYRKLLPPAR
jgi:alcohol dehydrogenase class IV